jgi:serine/threonine protein kinase
LILILFIQQRTKGQNDRHNAPNHAKNTQLLNPKSAIPNFRLQEHEARKIFRQVAQAVAYCHERHIIHRDLKPENILLDDDHDVKLVRARAT